MNKEMKRNPWSMPSAGYASPSVRVIAIRTRYAVLTTSPDIYNTDPSETEEDQNVF